MKTSSWDYARNILCVRLDGMGDVLMTGPAMRALKQSDESRRFTLLTSPAGAEAGKLLPEVDEVLVYSAPWAKATARRDDACLDLAWIERLRAHEFDAAVIFTGHQRNPIPAALMCFLADIPLRLAHCRENPYQLLTDWIPEPVLGTGHEVERQLALVGEVGALAVDDRLNVRVSEQSGDRILQRLIECGIDIMRPWAVIHPGAGSSSRRYPVGKYQEVGRSLALEHGFQIVITGLASETILTTALTDGIKAGVEGARVVDFTGKLSLEELAALLTVSPVLISNNTGTAHLAAACDTPVVNLYALTNPQHQPWRVRSRVLFKDVECRGCDMSICPKGENICLTGVPSEDVTAATLSLFHKNLGDHPGEKYSERAEDVA